MRSETESLSPPSVRRFAHEGISDSSRFEGRVSLPFCYKTRTSWGAGTPRRRSALLVLGSIPEPREEAPPTVSGHLELSEGFSLYHITPRCILYLALRSPYAECNVDVCMCASQPPRVPCGPHLRSRSPFNSSSSSFFLGYFTPFLSDLADAPPKVIVVFFTF